VTIFSGSVLENALKESISPTKSQEKEMGLLSTPTSTQSPPLSSPSTTETIAIPPPLPPHTIYFNLSSENRRQKAPNIRRITSDKRTEQQSRRMKKKEAEKRQDDRRKAQKFSEEEFIPPKSINKSTTAPLEVKKSPRSPKQRSEIDDLFSSSNSEFSSDDSSMDEEVECSEEVYQKFVANLPLLKVQKSSIHGSIFCFFFLF
jgi:hypothetical protein